MHNYGSISRTVEITDIQSPYCGQAVDEFENGSAMTALEALPLPPHRTCHGNPEVFNHTQSLASMYSETCGTTTTKAYLSELKKLAMLRGQ